MKIGIYGKTIKKEDKDLFVNLFSTLLEKEIEVFVFDELIEELKKSIDYINNRLISFNKNSSVVKDFKFLFSLGGDGTILSTICILKDYNIPVVGINTGRLGFLATINKAKLLEELNDIIDSNFNTSKRTLLSIKTKKNIEYPYAINDITVIRKETSSMLTIKTFINEEYFSTFWADGLIISTPTGSTGYSLSCGGPIIAPNTNVIIITPIAPHNLSARPIILDDSVDIKLQISSRADNYYLTLDSRLIAIDIDDEVLIKKSNLSINLVELKNYSYFTNLRTKLGWGEDKRN